MRNRALSARRWIGSTVILAVIGLLGAGVSSEAGPILAGTPAGVGSSTCIPYSCDAFLGYDTHLGVYSTTVSGESVWIIGITFFNTLGENGEGNTIPSASYASGFSMASASVGTLPVTLAGHAGPGNQPHFSGSLGGEIGGPSFTIAGTPFFYRPAPGHPPLQVMLSGMQAERQTPTFLDANADNGLFSNSTPVPSPPAGDADALAGPFDILAPIPEPATILLVGSGLVAVVRSRRRATRSRG